MSSVPPVTPPAGPGAVLSPPPAPPAVPIVPLTPPTPPIPPDWRKHAFDFLGDSTKQLITVATGVVTITILFSRDLLPHARIAALSAWVLLTISVIFGIWTLYTLSGILYEAAADPTKTPKLSERDLRIISGTQIIFFLLGISAVLVFGILAVGTTIPSETKPITVNCVVPPPPPPVVIQQPCPQPSRRHAGHPCKATSPPIVEK
jgi:hypothetical protein